MRSIFITTMILFLLTACGTAAQPVAPTATISPISTPTLAPTETPTAIATSTPESQLPEGELRNLQERLGKEFTLTETEEKDSEGNPVYQIVDKNKQPVSDTKIFRDGYSESTIEFNGKQFTAVVPLQTISVDDDKKLVWSGWKIENGEKTIISSPAFKEASEASSAAKLGIIINHEKESQMIDTLRMYTKLSLTNPYDEFRGINVKDS